VFDADGMFRTGDLSRLAGEVPARIVAVDAFPTVDGPNGPKVQRVRLREMAQTLLREEERGRRRDAGAGLHQH
jgi:hypothetical protein